MQYFVRTMERHRDSNNTFSEELLFPALAAAKEEAMRLVRASQPDKMLHADACFRNRTGVRTKYSCWINQRGEFQERSFV
jgi:hypothetical protein